MDRIYPTECLVTEWRTLHSYPEITVQTDVMSRKAGHSRYTEIEIITMVILMLCNVITIVIFTKMNS